MYVNLSHSITPAGHAYMLISFLRHFWTSPKPLTFWVFIFAFFKVIVKNPEIKDPRRKIFR